MACGDKGARGRRQRERKTETGWTVHYTPDKGQRDVLFMSQAVAAVAAAASGAKVEMSTRHRSPEPTVAQAASHRASGHASWLLLIMSKNTHTHKRGGGKPGSLINNLKSQGFDYLLRPKSMRRCTARTQQCTSEEAAAGNALFGRFLLFWFFFFKKEYSPLKLLTRRDQPATLIKSESAKKKLGFPAVLQVGLPACVFMNHLRGVSGKKQPRGCQVR